MKKITHRCPECRAYLRTYNETQNDIRINPYVEPYKRIGLRGPSGAGIRKCKYCGKHYVVIYNVNYNISRSPLNYSFSLFREHGFSSAVLDVLKNMGQQRKNIPTSIALDTESKGERII